MLDSKTSIIRRYWHRVTDRSVLTELVINTLAEARQQGADSVEIDVDASSGLEVTARMGEVEKIEHQQEKGIGVTVYMGQCKGSASSSDFGKAAIQETVKAACTIAKYTNEDDCAGLADADLMAQEIPDLELCYPWHITPEAAAEQAIECEGLARQQDPRISNSDGTTISTYTGSHVYGNSHGFVNGWDWSSHALFCNVIAETNQGMQCDGWYSKARDPNKLQNLVEVAKEAARRTVQRLNARKISTRQCPVIFAAPVASELFAAFISAISGNSLYRKASFLLDKLDQRVFAEHIQIYEQPHIKGALGSAPFDDEGLATRDRCFIEHGVLQSYVLSSYSARKLGLSPTGNAGGVRNLTVEPNAGDINDMLQQMGKGLLVTDTMGFGVNQLTGDYSRGVTGLWVENGKIQYAVEEVTIAGNLPEMYRQILQVGSDVDRRKNILTGSVLVENMTVAGS